MGDPILEDVKRCFPDVVQRLTVLEIIEDVMRLQRRYYRFLCVVFFVFGALSMKIVEWLIQ